MNEEDFEYLYHRIERKIESDKKYFEIIKPAEAPEWLQRNVVGQIEKENLDD